MQAKTLFQAGLLILLALSPAAFARDVIHTFKANDKKYEIYVGYGDSVYVTYGGSNDKKYEKGPAGLDGIIQLAAAADSPPAASPRNAETGAEIRRFKGHWDCRSKASPSPRTAPPCSPAETTAQPGSGMPKQAPKSTASRDTGMMY